MGPKCSDNIEVIEIAHKDIITFYKERPHIDIEQSQLLLIDFLLKWEMCEKTRNIVEVTHSDDTKQTLQISPTIPIVSFAPTMPIVSLYKEQDNLEFILNKLNPTSKIVSNKNSDVCCDYIVTTHNSSTKLLIENKNINQNVSEIVVDMFKKSCQMNSANGILMSQNTGIIGKEDFEIEIIGSNVIVYLHLVNYDECKINLAINMLNRVYDEVILANANSNTISDTTLNEIKVEYQHFTNNKKDLQLYIKNTHSAIVNKLENIKLASLGEYLSTKFTQVDKPKQYTCNFCDFYTSNTLKGMAAHKRGCKKKYPIIQQL